MTDVRFSRAPRSLTVIAALLVPLCFLCDSAVSGEAGRSTPHRWLDVDGRPLPFQETETILNALRRGEVVRREPIGRGVAGAEKLVLEYGGARFHAAFRTIDRREEDTSSRAYGRPGKSYLKDNAFFENAAFELSELLGMHRVPPVVERQLPTGRGSLQIWMEETAPEVVLKEQGRLEPPDVPRWHRQKQIMILLDNLVANRDRNQGNVLVDESWDLWFIDHTRAFGTSSRLLYSDRLASCERGIWARLKNLDGGLVRERLEPYLTSKEIARVLTRLKKIVRHLDRLIKKRGEEVVLFDMPPPAALSDEPGS